MRVRRFHILVVRPDVADVRKGEGDDLPRVGRVGHRFLVTGHRGVEAQLADRLPFRAEPVAPDRPAVGKDDDSRRALWGRRVQGSGVGHGLEEPFRQR